MTNTNEQLVTITEREAMEWFVDMLNDSHPGVEFEFVPGEVMFYEAAHVLESTDPIAFREQFLQFCQGLNIIGW